MRWGAGERARWRRRRRQANPFFHASFVYSRKEDPRRRSEREKERGGARPLKEKSQEAFPSPPSSRCGSLLPHCAEGLGALLCLFLLLLDIYLLRSSRLIFISTFVTFYLHALNVYYCFSLSPAVAPLIRWRSPGIIHE